MNSKTSREFLRIYEKYADSLFRHCYFRVRDRDIAKDILQNVFMRFWEHISRNGLNEIENVRAFMYRITHNAIVDEMRKSRPVSLDKLLDAGFQPSKNDEFLDKLHTKLEVGKIKKLFAALSQDFREVIIMRYIDELSPKEIAVVLGESANVVSVRLNRAIAELRNFISHE